VDKVRWRHCCCRNYTTCNRNARRYCFRRVTRNRIFCVKDGNAGVVESTKAASDIYTPVSGEIIENNQAIVDDPAKVNSDPENEAWFFKLKITDKSEMDSLMNKEEYEKFSKESGS